MLDSTPNKFKLAALRYLAKHGECDVVMLREDLNWNDSQVRTVLMLLEQAWWIIGRGKGGGHPPRVWKLSPDGRQALHRSDAAERTTDGPDCSPGAVARECES